VIDTDQDRMVQLHEAGHQAIAAVFGWDLGAITVRAGQLALGCSTYTSPRLPDWQDGMEELPFILWPQAHQSQLQQRVLVALAGATAACVLMPLADPEPVAAEAIQIVEEHPADEEDQKWAAEAVSNPVIRSDAEQVARLARLAHGDNNHSAHTWVEHLHAQTLALVERNERKIRRLADVLAEVEVLSGDAVAAMLREPR
jgi:hypothetical protein